MIPSLHITLVQQQNTFEPMTNSSPHAYISSGRSTVNYFCRQDNRSNSEKTSQEAVGWSRGLISCPVVRSWRDEQALGNRWRRRRCLWLATRSAASERPLVTDKLRHDGTTRRRLMTLQIRVNIPQDDAILNCQQLKNKQHVIRNAWSRQNNLFVYSNLLCKTQFVDAAYGMSH